MGNFRKNKRTASMARGRVDKAQNQLLKSMKKDIDELKSDVEAKYNVSNGQIKVDAYDGSTDATRSRNILSVPTGENQGTTDVTRIGDSVSLKHIDFNYHIIMPFTLSGQVVQEATRVRVLMLWDNQPNAITTTGAVNVNKVYWPQLLQNAKLNMSPPTIAEQKLIPISEKDWDNRKRFSIIYDKTHTFACAYSPGQATGGSATDGGLGPRSATGIVKFNKNYKGQKIRYTAGGSIPQNRQLYMAFISDRAYSSSIDARIPVCTYTVRTIYDDL
ncbi:MAG: putative coat protein [Circoviridae sp.]|nr:MAG: putative coat protein [Circoviridae sp.]